MSDAPGGEGWEQGDDGKWYRPGVLSGAGWWRATDGRWYRPEAKPAARVPQPAGKTIGERWATVPTYGKALAIGAAVLLVFAVVGVAIAAPDEEESVATTSEPSPPTTETTTTVAAPTTTAPTTTVVPVDQLLTFEDRMSDDQALSAYNVCKQFVERQLTSPGSAEYPDFFDNDDEVRITLLADNNYRVNSQVDSDNAFGASLRSFFECTVDYQGDDQWQLVDLQMI